MKHLLTFFAALALLLTSCSSDEPALAQDTLTRSSEESVTHHVSKADFDKYVPGKIWTYTATGTHPISQATYVNADGEYDWFPMVGTWHPRRAFRISANRYQEFDQQGPAWDDTKGPRLQINSFAYEYDETTGFLTCSERINYFSIRPNSIYVESVSEDKIVIREEYGILPIGFSDDISGTVSVELDPDSYRRTEYHAVPEQDVAGWYEKYTDMRIWNAIANSPEYRQLTPGKLLEEVQRVQLTSPEFKAKNMR